MRLRHRKRFCGRNFKSRFIRNAKVTRKLSSDLNLLYGKKVLIFLDEYADKPASDVDLLISANVKGLKFYGLVEEIREALHKKVDVLEINQLKDNLELTQEILKDGIKIYG